MLKMLAKRLPEARLPKGYFLEERLPEGRLPKEAFKREQLSAAAGLLVQEDPRQPKR